MKVGIRFGVCNNPPADLLHCECTRHLVIPHHHNQHLSTTKNGQQNRVKMGKWLKWLKMGEHGWQFNAQEAKKILLWNNQLVKKGQN